MDPSDHYPEPFGEALSYSSQRAAQLVSLAVAGAQVALHRKTLSEARKAERDGQARRALQAEARAMHEQARAGWAPAHDPRWLAQADLVETARAWSAAAPYADTDPVAASAMHRTEERLRTLHPYAMARYDRLRAGQASPLEAMHEAVPLFTREPHTRPGQPAAAHPSLGAAEAGPDSGPPDEATNGSPRPPMTSDGPGLGADQRALEIIGRMQARALAERGSELDPAELAAALEAATSLPAEVIARLARARNEEAVAAAAERARATDLGHAAGLPAGRPGSERAEDLRAARRETRAADTAHAHASGDRNAALLAAESFPCTAADGIRAAVSGTLQHPARSPVPAPATQSERRRGLSA